MQARFRRMRAGVGQRTAKSIGERIASAARARAALRRKLAMRTRAIAPSLGVELKFLDCAWNSVAIPAGSATAITMELQPSTGCTNAISVPAQGDGDQNRDGRVYHMKSLFFSGLVSYTSTEDQANVNDYGPLFFALVLDTQTNGAAINSEDVFTNPGTSGLGLFPQPLRNLTNSKRFRVLDSTMVFPNGAYAANDNAGTAAFTNTNTPMNPPTVKLSWNGDIKVTCTGSTANVSAVSDNSLHIIAFGANVTLGTPTLEGKSRLRFVG